jgi:hypothetical protein
MFDLASGWRPRMAGAVLPQRSDKAGWLIDHLAEPGFVEPGLRTIQGDPLTARAIIVAAPGAVGKSTFAKTLGALTSSVLIDLARTELLGGNFFVGGIANAFGIPTLTEAGNGRLGLVIDALDEAQLRSGAEGFSAGLSDLGRIVSQPSALPAVLFGRSAAAEEAWLVLSEAGLDPCLMEIEFFDEARALQYIDKKLAVLADRRSESRAAYARHADSFRGLATATRGKLIGMPGGDDPRFAGYAPVLDAVCSYAVEDENLNPQARIAQLSAESPVALIAEIAGAILTREQGKLVGQLREDVGLDGVDESTLYSPEEQLARLASVVIGAPIPAGPSFDRPEVRRAYDRMVANLAPQHPFLDARSDASNAAFASYMLVWAMTSGATPDAARRALAARPSLASGLLFELYMLWLTEDNARASPRNLNLADVGPLYAAFTSQAGQRQQASLEVTGEPGDNIAEVAFDMETAGAADGQARRYGPFDASLDGFLELRGPLANIRISAPAAVIVGDGSALNVTAPVEIDVESLVIDGREVRIFKSAGNVADEFQQVALNAVEVDAGRIERVTVLGGRLTVSFPGARSHPWTDYAVIPPVAPSPEVEVLRRRLRKVLTAFRSHSKGTLVRLAAKIDHARMMKRGDLGPRLINQLLVDGILTTFDAGKFYVLHPDQMGAALNMDYQALLQQRWSSESDEYLGRLAQ